MITLKVIALLSPSARSPPPAMLTYADARDRLVKELRENALDHEAGNYDTIGRRFDRLEHEFPVGTEPELGRLHIGLALSPRHP